MKNVLTLAALTLFCALQAAPVRLPARDSEWKIPAGAETKEKSFLIRSTAPETNRWTFARLPLHADEYAGQIIRLEAEIRADGIRPVSGKKSAGAKLMFVLSNGQKQDWPGIIIPSGTFNWEKFGKTVVFPTDLKQAELVFGLQDAAGEIEIRNLKISSGWIPLELNSIANADLRDRTAGDGKGGWSDQGPKNDGRIFVAELNKRAPGGIPMNIGTRGKTVLALKSKNLPSGMESGTVKAAKTAKAKTLFVAHAICWAGNSPEKFGKIIVNGKNGSQTFTLETGRDGGDWFNPAHYDNAVCAIEVESGDNSKGIHLSRFPLKDSLGEIESVRFESVGGNPVWLVLGATLSAEERPLPRKKTFAIRAGKEWQTPIRTVNYHWRKPGSPLDVSSFTPRRPIGADDWLKVNADGHLVLAREPDKPLRFFCSPDEINLGYPKRLANREQIDVYVGDLVTHGFNMIRIHINKALMKDAKAEADFNRDTLDAFDYLVSLCRKNGIYIMMNLQEIQYGFYPYEQYSWGNPKPFSNKTHTDMRTALYFSAAARENWKKGVVKLLTRVNPLTGLAPKDDPVFAMLLGYNEQEFAFHYRPVTPQNRALAIGPWREFMKKRYGTIATLNSKKGTSYKSFDELPCYNIFKKDADTNEFIYQTSLDLLHFYQGVLKEIGYKGLFSNYDFVKSLLYHFVRSETDYVGMHVYCDHPLGKSLVEKGAYNRQYSSIGRGNYFARELAGCRIFRKPVVCSEYDMPFWNRYRYERSFTFGAYAAFQDADVLTPWGSPVQRQPLDHPRVWVGGRMAPFVLCRDPLSDASLLLTYFMFIRGDVAPAKHGVRIIADRDSVFANDPNSQPALEQTALALLTGYSQQSVFSKQQIVPQGKNEILLPSLGGGRSHVDGWFTETLGTTGNIAGAVALLKKKGFLTADNRSDGLRVYENETKELYLDSGRKFMSVSTPRLQGVCMTAGDTAKLPDFEVISHNSDGNLSLVSIDGRKPIRDASRLLLIRLTNALNSDMVFEDSSMRKILSPGVPPGLLKNSAFKVRIRHPRASSLKLYPLTLEGVRTGRVVSPETAADETAVFSVDTAKDGNTVYFEIRANENTAPSKT